MKPPLERKVLPTLAKVSPYHSCLKASKVVSGSEYPLYSIAGFLKAGGDQVALSSAQPHS